MKFKIILFFITLFLLPHVVFADDINLTWTSPVGDGTGDTGRSDGSAISADEITGYRIYIGVKTGVYTVSVDVLDNLAESYTLKEMWDNTYYIVVTTIDTGDRESVLSNETVAVTGAKPIFPPKQPANLKNTVVKPPV